jgi:hypothetical protein
MVGVGKRGLEKSNRQSRFALRYDYDGRRDKAKGKLQASAD